MADLDKVIDGVLKLRARRAEIKKSYEEQDAKLVAQIEMLEEYINSAMKSLNVTQLKGQSGIAYKTERVVFSCKDWNLFTDWAIKNSRVDFLQKRLTNTAIKEFVDETGIIPPGLSAIKLPEINVRKGK